MLDFFGTPWVGLTAEDVEAFLADAGDEGLTWEAKGREQPHRDTVRKGVCGLANARGGFFIVGAEPAQAGGWALNGVTFRSSEPGTWLSSVITSGLHPVPTFDVKTFERGDGRHAALVAVEPVAVPPCITTSGVVYQRVTGQTLPVTDQRVLAELYRRGRAARGQAELLALRAAERALGEPAVLTPQESQLAVGFCPVSGADDKAAVIFTRSFTDRVTEVVQRGLQVDAQLRYSCHGDIRQDGVRVWPASHGLGSSWCAAVYWDGSVSAVFATPSDELYVDELIGRAKQAWRVLAQLAELAGGSGEAHLVVRVRSEHPAVAAHRRGHPSDPARCWTAVSEPRDEELDRLARELSRGFGQAAWEPEP